MVTLGIKAVVLKVFLAGQVLKIPEAGFQGNYCQRRSQTPEAEFHKNYCQMWRHYALLHFYRLMSRMKL
ncbi:hypothetical protein scyTo_0018977 [Scyliorhinus torazame]|uniref:Uncharacterized protein n=1 Tax=Scyliorhinus torazame TaxID=75743 RepID=A0A401PQ16_SCYTO|nr:hypothetical protein [Scyliorhinus torazame]